MIFDIFNNYAARLLFAFIFSGTIASPYINGYSENPFWIPTAIVLFGAFIASVVVGYQFKKWLTVSILVSFAIVCTIFFFQWGR
jgi:hypothetical protein